MRVLGFRTRLALFFVATLILVQGVTAVLAYDVARRQLVTEGGRQLTANAGAFVAQMNDLSASVANGVQIMSLDYGLRSAIGARDKETILSVLRNHGRRVGAIRRDLHSRRVLHCVLEGDEVLIFDALAGDHAHGIGDFARRCGQAANGERAGGVGPRALGRLVVSSVGYLHFRKNGWLIMRGLRAGGVANCAEASGGQPWC